MSDSENPEQIPEPEELVPREPILPPRKPVTEEEHPLFTWLPRREDYEEKPEILADETYSEKVERLCESIKFSQDVIKEVVDGNSLTLEIKIFKVFDTLQDLRQLGEMRQDCEKHKDAGEFADKLKQAKIGLINLQAFLSQVDPIEFAKVIRNEQSFKVGVENGFGPWLDKAEVRIKADLVKPTSYPHAHECEEQACFFLREVVRKNKDLKQLKEAAEGIRGNVQVQETIAKLQERYFVLCKRADETVKQIQHLLIEWKKMDDVLAPRDPKDMDDLQCKQMVVFLRSYATVYG